MYPFSIEPSVLRREQQLCNSNSPPQQVRPWVCCMLRDTANVETIPHVRLATSEPRKQSTVPLARLSREARSPKAVIPQPNNSASNAQRDSRGSAAASLQRAHFRQRRFSVQSTLVCLNNSCPLRSAASQPPAVANTDRPTKHPVKPRTGAASRASTFEAQRAHQRPFRSIQPEQSPRMPRTLACHSPAH